MKFLAIGSTFSAALGLAVFATALTAQNTGTHSVLGTSTFNQSSDQADGKCTGTREEIKKCKREKRSQRRGSYD